MTDKEWDNIYAHYVIREDRVHGNYIMETEEVRCALRKSAARFTKQQAINYIECHKDEKFIVEDAI